MRQSNFGWFAGIAISLVLSPLVAAADEVERDSQAVLLTTREILDHMDIEERTSTDEPGWLSSHFRLAGKGVKYSQPLVLGGRDLLLNVSGPVMPRRSLGLSFEVKF